MGQPFRSLVVISVVLAVNVGIVLISPHVWDEPRNVMNH